MELHPSTMNEAFQVFHQVLDGRSILDRLSDSCDRTGSSRVT